MPGPLVAVGLGLLREAVKRAAPVVARAARKYGPKVWNWGKNQVGKLRRRFSKKKKKACQNCKPTKTKNDIDRGKQNNHVEGTNEHKMRSNSPNPNKQNPSTWKDGKQADDLTVEAYDKGVKGPMRPDGSYDVKHDFGRTVGNQGQTQVTVKVSPSGKIHGVPSGPRSP